MSDECEKLDDLIAKLVEAREMRWDDYPRGNNPMFDPIIRALSRALEFLRDLQEQRIRAQHE
jgi:hypothetical protein